MAKRSGYSQSYFAARRSRNRSGTVQGNLGISVNPEIRPGRGGSLNATIERDHQRVVRLASTTPLSPQATALGQQARTEAVNRRFGQTLQDAAEQHTLGEYARNGNDYRAALKAGRTYLDNELAMTKTAATAASQAAALNPRYEAQVLAAADADYRTSGDRTAAVNTAVAAAVADRQQRRLARQQQVSSAATTAAQQANLNPTQTSQVVQAGIAASVSGGDWQAAIDAQVKQIQQAQSTAARANATAAQAVSTTASQAARAAAAPTPVAPPAPTPPPTVAPAAGQVAVSPTSGGAAIPTSSAGLTVQRFLGGSTGANLVTDAAGNEYVRKGGANAAHLREETTADAAYQAIGIAVPDFRVLDENGTLSKVARFIPGARNISDIINNGPASLAAKVVKDAEQGFAMDALMANRDVTGRDVTGKGGQNTIVDQNDKVWRIDNGGSLRFRGGGQPKADYDAYPTEIFGLRDDQVNPRTAKVFGRLGYYDTMSQVKNIESKRAALMAVLPADLKKPVGDRLDNMVYLSNVADTMRNSGKYNERQVEAFSKKLLGGMKSGSIVGRPNTIGELDSLYKTL